MQDSEAAEVTVDTKQTRRPSVLIGVTGSVGLPELQQRMQEAEAALDANVVVAYPGTEEVSGQAEENTGVLFRNYSPPASDPESLPWTSATAAQRALCSLAAELQVDVCVLLHSDLLLLRADLLQLLIQPVLEKRCDLVLPVYTSRKFEGLLNHGVLAPISRALYGLRVRYPLPQDFSCSDDMCVQLSEATGTYDLNADGVLWPATIAAVNEKRVCQVNIDVNHGRQTEGLELRTALASLVGSAYADMERCAAFWQRVRSTQATAMWGTIAKQADEADAIDVKPMVESFLLGANNLQEVWGAVLPPVTLLELRKLTRLEPESFRLPDDLWVRIIYDFALAHRLRTISRSHLLGALTPLYLGWVASYVQEVSNVTPMAAEHRLEQLERAYEENKPYLLRRWRWPDRFNP
ncbi:MAG TPA: hypothetical protein VHT24_11605 [Pseudacidobacterium sp.]|jgi:hypothetical protein|nr:hypothetical protein [Pseudacidobacterium sp.]